MQEDPKVVSPELYQDSNARHIQFVNALEFKHQKLFSFVSLIYLFSFFQRAVLKFAQATGATPIAGRFTPGTFTNQIQKAFREPRLH